MGLRLRNVTVTALSVQAAIRSPYAVARPASRTAEQLFTFDAVARPPLQGEGAGRPRGLRLAERPGAGVR
jgi:hypothetical protein